MAHCLVNNTPEILDLGPETWGQLLETLDRSLVANRRVVTAVRFDGVDQPSFRSGALATAELARIARVDIDAEDAATLLSTAVTAAADSLPGLVTGVRMTAAALRAGAAHAHTDVVALVAAVQSLVALTAAAATAAHLSMGETPGADPAVVNACGDLETALRALVAHQALEHWPALADALDADLAPAIAHWHDVLEPIRERAHA